MKIVLDPERCTGCGICGQVCPQRILEMSEGRMRVKEQARCMGCFGCEDECPTGAVRVLRARHGVLPIVIEPPPRVTQCDVAVVGAGPAGLGAAIACARAGLDVVVFERLPNRTISHHADGGILLTLPWLTTMRVERGMVSFPELDISLAADFAKPCRVLGLVGPGGLRTRSHLPHGITGWAGQKDLFVSALADEAERAGARLWFNAKVSDVLRKSDSVAGVKLDTGQEIRSRVVVTADGMFARVSEKAGMRISNDDLWYACVLACEYENRAGLPSGLYYLNGEMHWEDDMPVAFGGVAVTDVIHVLIAFLSRKRVYPAPRPMDHYLQRLLESDMRVRILLGDALRGASPVMLNGCRGVFRARCNTDTVGHGVVSVGDAWVDDGELGNVPALANGVHAGRVIADAARMNDFSKAALKPANRFLDRRLLRVIAENKRMKLLSATLSEEEMRRMFLFMRHLNYPVLMLGSPGQRAGMFTGFLFKNLFRFIRYPRIARLIVGS